MGDVCCGIPAAQRASQGDLLCGHRNERGLQQGREREPWKRSTGVRQISRHPESIGGVQRGSQSPELVRCREARALTAGSVDVLKNQVNWTEKETQEFELMAVEGRGGNQKMFWKLCFWVNAIREQTMDLLEPMARIARMIEGHLEGSLAH